MQVNLVDELKTQLSHLQKLCEEQKGEIAILKKRLEGEEGS